MKARIIVHSSSGNTRLVAEYAGDRLTKAGLACDVKAVAKQSERHEIDDVDVLGIAFPVMYFRPTLVIERIVDSLPTPKAGTPAFVLATAGGEPGAAMELIVEQLQRKGFVVIGAHWVVAQSNWPMQLALFRQPRRIPGVARLQDAVEGVIGFAWSRWPDLRPLANTLWEPAGQTVERDRVQLDRYLDTVVGATQSLRGGARPSPVDVESFGARWARWFGQNLDPSQPAARMGLRALPDACTKCGACVRACPADCVVADAEGLPEFHDGCTGCWACYNACPHGAIAASGTPAGLGRYTGPSPAMRELLSC